MSLPTPPNITKGQLALDPVNGIVYYRDDNDNLVATTWSWLRQDLSEVITDDNVTITGDLTVSGTTVSVNVETVMIDDNILVLNSNVTGIPSENAGIEIERGSSTNVQIRWNETTDTWQYTNDGSNFYDINSIIADSVQLGYHTTGDYVATITSGTGIAVTNTGGEGATPNIALNASLDDLNDAAISSALNGQLLVYNGTNWVNTTLPSGEPIGHENREDSVISFNESTREFSIAPASTSYTVWCAGKRYIKTGTETVTIPDTSGLYYIYFNSSGSLAYKTTYFTWDQDTPTAYIYWNDVENKAYFFADERHGVTLDWATHEYLHRTRGAAIANGFGVNNYVLGGNGSSNSHCQIDFANGTFFDEDLQVDIEHSATPTANTWEQRLQSGAYIPMFYRSNSSWKKDTATQYPIKSGSSIATYNLNTAGTWTTPDINNNQFGISWIIATNNLNEPIVAILSQDQYTNVGEAEAVDFSSLDLDGFPVFEFRPLYKFIFDTSTNYSNTPKARLVSLVDIRSTMSGGTGAAAVAVSDHGNLTGLSDDDHTQYFNSARHDAHDHSSALSSASLNDLGDVIIASATPNQVLKFNGTNWVNDTESAGSSVSGDNDQFILAIQVFS